MVRPRDRLTKPRSDPAATPQPVALCRDFSGWDYLSRLRFGIDEIQAEQGGARLAINLFPATVSERVSNRVVQ